MDASNKKRYGGINFSVTVSLLRILLLTNYFLSMPLELNYSKQGAIVYSELKVSNHAHSSPENDTKRNSSHIRSR